MRPPVPIFGPQSDIAEARRVDVIVIWNGYRVAHELAAAPVGGQTK